MDQTIQMAIFDIVKHRQAICLKLETDFYFFNHARV